MLLNEAHLRTIQQPYNSLQKIESQLNANNKKEVQAQAVPQAQAGVTALCCLEFLHAC